MHKNLKILMLAPTPYFSDRGCHVRIYEEAKALKARGHEVVIVTYHLGHDVGDIPVARIPKIPWYRKISAGPSWHKPFLDILLLYKTIVVARKFKPDIIHAHLHEGAFLAAIAKRSLKAPLVFDCQGSLCGELLDHGFMSQNGLLHRFFTKLESWINRQADFIVTSSTPTAATLCREFPEIALRVKSFPDAVDTKFFKPASKDLKLFDELSLPRGKKLLVYLGAMTAYQGVDLLLDALKILSLERDDFHALLMGYPEAGYIERAKKNGLDSCTTFTGKLDYSKAARYLNLGDIALSPKLSTTEANGKLLNYMAVGLPIIATDSLVNRELLGDAGIYMRETTATDLSQCIAEILDDEVSRCELSKRARLSAVGNHSWNSRILALESIYHKTLPCLFSELG